MQALGDEADLVVDIPRPAADFPRLVIALFYHPEVGDGSQDGHQCGVRHHDDAFLVAVIEQVLVVLHRLDIGGLNRHEHQHKIRAAYAGQVDVILGCQVIDVVAHGLGVGIEGQRLLLFGVGGDGAIVIHQ